MMMDKPNVPRRIKNAAISEAGFLAAWMALITGPFLAGFAVELNAGKHAQALLASIPFMAAGAQLVGAWLVELHGVSRRVVALAGYTTSRIAFLSIVPAGFWLLPDHPTLMLYMFLGLIALSFALHHVGHVAWMSWLTHSIPAARRGEFFGARNHLAGLVTVIIMTLGGWLASQKIDGLPAETGGYLLFFLLVGVLGLMGSRSLMTAGRAPVSLPPADRPSLMSAVRTCLQPSLYRQFLVFNLVFMGAVYVAAPFFIFFMLAEGLDIQFIALTQTSLTIAALVSVRMWGSLCDHFGSRPIQIVTLTGAALLPLGYLFADAGNIRPLMLITQTVSGTVWAGLSLSSYNWLLKLSPKDTTAMHLATFGTLTGVACGLAPLLGGVMLDGMRAWEVAFGSLTMNHFKLLFLFSFLTRSLSMLLIVRIPEPDARTTIDVVRALGTWRSLRSVTGVDMVYSYVVAPISKRLQPEPSMAVELLEKGLLLGRGLRRSRRNYPLPEQPGLEPIIVSTPSGLEVADEPDLDLDGQAGVITEDA